MDEPEYRCPFCDGPVERTPSRVMFHRVDGDGTIATGAHLYVLYCAACSQQFTEARLDWWLQTGELPPRRNLTG